RQQKAGQFHLAGHFDLRVERRVPGMCLAGEGCIVLWCCQRRMKSGSSATWVEIFMPVDSLPSA
ncbi:hypothetical protein KG914_004593, partial [Escherichia coli]|nr:hypothetical protein [Escherichia coli]